MINKSLRMLARCPGVVAERILERAKAAESPDSYIIASVTELETWDRECRAKALEVLSRHNSVHSITLALWIEDGSSGTEFARKERISRDCLYQRKLRARLEILDQLDSRTAAWLYSYGHQRYSIQRGETMRRKTACAPRRAA